MQPPSSSRNWLPLTPHDGDDDLVPELQELEAHDDGDAQVERERPAKGGEGRVEAVLGLLRLHANVQSLEVYLQAEIVVLQTELEKKHVSISLI